MLLYTVAAMFAALLATVTAAPVEAENHLQARQSCGWGMVFVQPYNTCICYPGWKQNPTGSQCCSPNSYWDNTNGCVCNPGTTWNDAAKTCVGAVPQCPVSTTPSNNQCVCKRGWIAAPLGQCCPPNSFWNNSTKQCVCKDGNPKLADGSCGLGPTCPRAPNGLPGSGCNPKLSHCDIYTGGQCGTNFACTTSCPPGFSCWNKGNFCVAN
ncbi:hypothetical protein BDR26DRAFT_114502 [Obelidium mucronatum]|nr:hypothetical protein BDR26DRAFT_114502 [Obelidium mucronatum]